MTPEEQKREGRRVRFLKRVMIDRLEQLLELVRLLPDEPTHDPDVQLPPAEDP